LVKTNNRTAVLGPGVLTRAGALVGLRATSRTSRPPWCPRARSSTATRTCGTGPVDGRWTPALCPSCASPMGTPHASRGPCPGRATPLLPAARRGVLPSRVRHRPL